MGAGDRTRRVGVERQVFTEDLVLVDGYLYGFNDSILVCLDFATGKMMWRDRSVGKGSVTYADGHLYIQGENDVLGLAEATPSGYREKGRLRIPDKGYPSWAHPAISDGRLRPPQLQHRLRVLPVDGHLDRALVRRNPPQN